MPIHFALMWRFVHLFPLKYSMAYTDQRGTLRMLVRTAHPFIRPNAGGTGPNTGIP